MNGNDPYGGRREVVAAGRRATQDLPELSGEQRRTLRAGVVSIAARTRELLPDEFVVGGELVSGPGGPQAMVAVRPPAGDLVSAGLDADPEDVAALDDEEREEVARGLAATAALQAKNAAGDDPAVAR